MESLGPSVEEFMDAKLKSGGLTTNQLYEALVSPRIVDQATNLITASQQLASQLVDDFFDQTSPSDQ
jgi:hypothetical protein